MGRNDHEPAESRAILPSTTLPSTTVPSNDVFRVVRAVKDYIKAIYIHIYIYIYIYIYI